ncbi:MAG: hypothetical protein A2X64_09405 [Ignavibacteria bacterium GWF2_33_9]|nr:MAG: hypothetical protein A2X64_09405 [Ignavibacteria bacterium GWF2_33_9]
MKKIYLLVIIIFLIALNGCKKEIYQNKIILNSDTLLVNMKYNVKLNIKNQKDMIYLQLFCKSATFPNYTSKVYKMQMNNSIYETDFTLEDSCYYVQFSITNGKNVLPNVKPIEKIVYQKYSTYLQPAFFELLLKSEKNSYLNISNYFIKKYPWYPGIFLIKWYYEGTTNIADKNSLLDDLKYIEAHYKPNPDFFLVLAIGYKLIGDIKMFNYYWEKIQHLHSSLFNNDFVCNIINDVFKTSINKSMNNNKMKESYYKVMNNNTYSFFNVRRLTSIISNDIKNDSIINKLLLVDKYNYFELLLKKYLILTTNYETDSVKIINEIESEFEKAYQNPIRIYEEGYNNSFSKLPNKRIFLELKKNKFFVLKDYNKVVLTILEQNIEFSEDEKSMLILNYKDISDIYLNKLFDVDSSLHYLIKAYDLNTNNQKIINAISVLKSNYYNTSLNVNSWIDSLRLSQRKISSNAKTMTVRENILILKNNEVVNLNNPEKNVVLFFYSTTCGPCKFIFNQIILNLQWVYHNNINIYFISEEDLNLVQDFIKNKNNKFEYVVNAKNIFNNFKITNVPVLIYLDKSGKILNIHHGASENWNLIDEFSMYY